MIALALLFFLGHVAATIPRVRSATTRDDRLEALGLLVRGLPGLMLAVAVAARSWRPFALALAVATLPTFILGRPIYELIVFRSRSGR